jgi:hypothetical protein
MQGIRPGDGDRLPWLEPYREIKAPGKPLPRRGYLRPIAVGAAMGLLIAVGGAGYWLGQRGDQPQSSVQQPSATVALPPPKPAPVKVPEAPPAMEPVIEDPAPASPAEADKPAPAKKIAKRKPPPRKKIRSAGIERRRLNAVRAAQDRRVSARPWPKMPSPGPPGRVIQLGAFSTPVRAHSAYSARIARYPTLATMPRVVVPVVTKPDGRVLYVLRLGTASRQQSKTVCRNLRASGDHCLVIG